MKIKLEYIILGVLVIAVSLYLLLRERDRMRYKLPTLEPISSEEISRIEINRQTATVELVRSGDIWQILPDGHRADAQRVRDILNTIETLSITDLVSVSKVYDKFELGNDTRIGVTAFQEDTVVRRFYVGSSARTSQHTYITVPDDARVFHARGNLRSTFDRDREDLRDKLVLSFESSTITEIEIKKDSGSLRLIRTVGADNTQAETQWKTPTGEQWDNKKVDNLLKQLSNLRCTKYLTEKPDPSQTLASAVLIGNKTYRLDILNKSGSEYPGVSSEADSAFLLSSYIVEELLSLAESN